MGSPVENLGQDAAKPKPRRKSGAEETNGKGDEEKYDKLELRNRTVVETLSPVDDLGQDAKPAKSKGDETNGMDEEKYDKLELRNRTVVETLSPVDDLGQDKKEEPEAKKQKFDTLALR